MFDYPDDLPAIRLGIWRAWVTPALSFPRNPVIHIVLDAVRYSLAIRPPNSSASNTLTAVNLACSSASAEHHSTTSTASPRAAKYPSRQTVGDALQRFRYRK